MVGTESLSTKRRAARLAATVMLATNLVAFPPISPSRRKPRTILPVVIAFALLLSAMPGLAAPPDGSPGRAGPPPDTRCDEVTCALIRLDDDSNPDNVLDTTAGSGAADDLYWGDARLWSSAADGAGSGLDADLLDGLDSGQFLRSDVSGTLDGNLTVTGNVGIGTTQPRADAMLEVNGHARIEQLTAGDFINGNGPISAWGSDSQDAWLGLVNAEGWQSGDQKEWRLNMGRGTGDDFTLTAFPEQRTALHIQRDGDVGIGTTDPQSRLHVAQGGLNTFAARVEQTNDVNSNGLQIRTSTTKAVDAGLSVESPAGYNFIVRNNGDVGIGVRDPAAKLDVAGNVRVAGNGNGMIFPDGTKQTTAATTTGTGAETVQILREDFDNGHMADNIWTVSSVGNGEIWFDNTPGAIRMDTSSSSGGDSVTLRSNKQFSVNDGTLIFKGMLSAYRDHTVYGDGQPRGLAAGTDRNNAIEFVSVSPTSVACRAVKDGVATQTIASIGNVYQKTSYQIVAEANVAKCYVDGDLVATHMTNIPTVPLNLLFTSFDGGAGTTPLDLYSASFEIRR